MNGIIGSAPAMRKLFKLIERVAAADSTVLIHGESGTGKELICRAIHNTSPRHNGPLIAVNCGAIPEDLLESELFGHAKGSFTGAVRDRPGKFVTANNGTIFLDEIGDMSPKLQVKMLRVLQERIVEPVGALRSVEVNVRVIAATHKNLSKEVEEGRFREDLFYRLNVVPIQVPPLRDRIEDVSSLVEHFMEKCAARSNCPPVKIGAQVMSIFQRYSWKGNVRELENLMERLIVLADDEVTLDDLPENMLDTSNHTEPRAQEERIPVQAFRVAYNDDDEDEGDGEMVLDDRESVTDFNHQVEQYENQLILNALNRTGWNKNKAAQLLKLNRTTLVEKIKKKGLEDDKQSEQRSG
ncbi:sigma54 specific transcriptional regulator, Fis family [Magnetococcus marinus MC-1]|uniref:Sigma54 specific transcriptional regulator, Fis family n=1 Tax=Magnetococcus marinus (strain ATCC BAA-1437 / JCM 17883 / MC-1) TaxID=156889 RepID=A0L4D6_MAGMM|nr:sigma-54 dependent transcriptional regulator [Magnetococcus marinus]ABK42829.1 sigma54 specific transcriptional regulator, Fis family [Magnetococcus marinus MC-1]